MSTQEALLESNLGDVPLARRGKVRDVYDLDQYYLIVATDRISAFDVVLPAPIPDKGRILTQLSVFWFEQLGVEDHLVTAELERMPPALHAFADQLEGRSMLVRKLAILPVECVVRGYLAGSGWRDYQRSGAVCGVALPAGLVESDRLPEPIFTPTTKAETGHDEPMTFDDVAAAVGRSRADELREKSLAVYSRAAGIARERGVILCDTKFEWGVGPGASDIVLADEVLTPDSSRFWSAAAYAPGKGQESYDKQFVRDYLSGLDWDRTPPGPELPASVVEGTSRRYREIFELITGREWKAE